MNMILFEKATRGLGLKSKLAVYLFFNKWPIQQIRDVKSLDCLGSSLPDALFSEAMALFATAKDEYFFSSPNGRRYSQKYIIGVVEKALAKINVNDPRQAMFLSDPLGESTQ